MTTEDEDIEEGDIVVGGTKLTGLHDGMDSDDVEVLGYATSFTIGEFLEVPAAFLEDKAEEVGLDESYLPRKPTPKKAYTRACKRLFWDVNNDIGGMFGKYAVNTEKAQDTTGLWIIRAKKWNSDEEDYEEKAIGNLAYDYDAQEMSPTQRTTEPELVEIYDEVAQMAYREFDDMLESYTGSDLRGMVRKVIGSQYSVKLNPAGAYYFVPENQAEDVRKVAEIIESCNAFKKKGRPRAAVGMVKTIDAEHEKTFVQARVESELTEEIEKTLDNAVEKLEESDGMGDELEKEITEMVEETLEETTDVATQYNALLRAEMKIPEITERLANNIREEIREVVEEVLNEREQEPVEA